MKITNPFKVTEGDTIGTAIIKGAAKSYVKTTVAGAIGLGVLAFGIISLSNMADSEEGTKNLYKVTVELKDGTSVTHDWYAIDMDEASEMAKELHGDDWDRVEVQPAV